MITGPDQHYKYNRKMFATDRAIYFISILYGDFLDTITNNCFMSSLMHCALSLHLTLRSPKCLWHHTSQIEHLESHLSVCRQVMEQMHVDCNFCHQLFSPLLSELLNHLYDLMMYCSFSVSFLFLFILIFF